MWTAVFGLIGTLTGALVTWLGQHALLRWQERRRRLDLQRTAATEFLAAADLFIAEADSLKYAVEVRMPDEQVRTVYGRYYEQWSVFQRSRASVALTSIESIRAAASPVVQVVENLVRAADNIYLHRTMPRGANGWGQMYAEARETRDGFAELVRNELGVPDASLTAPGMRRADRRLLDQPSAPS